MNSFRFVFINLKKNLICFFANILILALNIGLIFLLQKYFLMVITIELLIFVLVYPCFNALLVQYCTFPAIKKFIIDPYYAEHPDEDLDKRHDLGLDLPQEEESTDENDEDEEESDVIFED